MAQRLEMVTRIAREIEDYVLELGTDGRLLSLQLEELVTGVDAERELVIRDYLPVGRRGTSPENSLQLLGALSATELVDPASVARALSLGNGEHLDSAVAPRGYRLLAKVPRLPTAVVDRLVDHFGTLQKLLSAGIDDLQVVEGVGELRARSVREGLSPAGRVEHPRRPLLLARRRQPCGFLGFFLPPSGVGEGVIVTVTTGRGGFTSSTWRSVGSPASAAATMW